MFSKKLLHVNSYYKRPGETPSNFTYSNPDPALSKTRKIELISASFLNSDTNINASNNTLQFQRESVTGLTRTLTENSIFRGKTSGGCFVSGQSNPLDRLQLNYKWTEASENRYFLNLFINPNSVEWGEDNPPTGPSHLDVSADSFKIRKFQQNDFNTIYPSFILPTPTTTDEKLVVIPYTFTKAQVTENNFFWIELTVINNNQSFLFTGYLDNLNELEVVDPSVVNLDEGYKLVLLPSKIGDQLHGFQYMIITDDNFNEYQLQDVKKGDVVFEAFPVNTNIVCSKYNPPVPFFQDNAFSTGNVEFSIRNSATGTVITYDNIVFDLEGQLVRIFELETISVPIGQYTIDTLMRQIQVALISEHQITISKTEGNETWLNALGKITFTSSVKISIDQKYNDDVYNPMSYILGINRDDHLLTTEFVSDSIPDISGIVSMFIHSDALSQADRTLNAGFSDSTIAVIPVFSEYGSFNFWSSPYQGKFMRSFQEPTNLNTFDIKLKDLTSSRNLALESDVCLCFQITYQS